MITFSLLAGMGILQWGMGRMLKETSDKKLIFKYNVASSNITVTMDFIVMMAWVLKDKL